MTHLHNHINHTMFTINGYPASEFLTPFVLKNQNKTISELEDTIQFYFPEDWYNTKTPSLKGNDNRLRHRIRSIRAQYGLTY